MFAFFTRKLQLIFTLPPSLDWEEVSASELQNLKGQHPKVYYTLNPAFCWADSATSVEYEQLSDQVRVCKQLVKSEEDFRGALRRELVWREQSHDFTSPSDYAIGVITSCKAELSAVANLDPVTAKLGTKICSLQQARRKVPNSKKCQVDEWHFYTKQLIEDNFYVYDRL